MCQDCGCGDVEIVSVELHERILSGNERAARHNREHFEEHGVLAVNLMGSPGAGKTALLEAVARTGALRLAAVSGDLATDHDARRLQAAGIPAATITTGTACHLDAAVVHRALHDFPLAELDVFVVENVGNLVCPAVYDLGEAVRVVALSITEGEDKPLKYPVMFHKADLVVVTKIDLQPHLGADMAALGSAIAAVAPGAHVIEVSARTGQGVLALIDWLGDRRSSLAAARAPAEVAR